MVMENCRTLCICGGGVVNNIYSAVAVLKKQKPLDIVVWYLWHEERNAYQSIFSIISDTPLPTGTSSPWPRNSCMIIDSRTIVSQEAHPIAHSFLFSLTLF